MIKTKKDLKFYLGEDAKRNGVNVLTYRLKLLAKCESACIYQYIRCLRHCEYHFNNKNSSIYHNVLYLFYKLKLYRLQVKYNMSVRLNSCGYGLRIMHIGGGTRIGPLKAGNYCGFNVGCVIGTNGSESSRPILGDRVAFGPGAKSFGNVTIGNNVFVAANSVVTKDVMDNVIVGGIPAKIIKYK